MQCVENNEDYRSNLIEYLYLFLYIHEKCYSFCHIAMIKLTKQEKNYSHLKFQGDVPHIWSTILS